MMSGRELSVGLADRPPEADRDQSESAFTAMLRRVWRSVPNVLSVSFVDYEGECIDYVSSVDPFEAKVSAAHMQVMLNGLRATAPSLKTGEHRRCSRCVSRTLATSDRGMRPPP